MCVMKGKVVPEMCKVREKVVPGMCILKGKVVPEMCKIRKKSCLKCVL